MQIRRRPTMRYVWILVAVFLGFAVVSSGRAKEGSPATDGINLRQTVTVEVVKKTKDAVVNISATKMVAQRVSPFDPFWQFGGGDMVRADSLGSGFIIHSDGYVVTNH